MLVARRCRLAFIGHMSRIAIIGAGLAGLHVTREMARAHEVVVFEKSRGPGGRMATRYADDWHFDHGAQFFTARTDAFRRLLSPLIDAGVVAHWPARFAEISGSKITKQYQWDADYPHFVGVPNMNAVGKYLAQELDIRTSTGISALEPIDSGWAVVTSSEHAEGPFDWVVVAAPAQQTAALLPTESPLHRISADCHMKSCYALMLGFDRPLDTRFDAAVVRERDISWVSINSSKPGRGDATAVVVHASNAWSDRNIDTDLKTVQGHMLDEFGAATGIDYGDTRHVDVQRWRYANIDSQHEVADQVDAERRLAICGDWLVRGRVESAFLSSERLLSQMSGMVS